MSETPAMDDEIQDYIDGMRHGEEPVEQGLTSNKAEQQSPGEMLREARLARGYSVEELCSQTMLSSQMIEALEDDRYDALSQPVFARGYFRKCGKVLDMDGEALMAACTAAGVGRQATANPAPITSVNIVPADVTPERRRRFGGIFLILVLLVAGFAVYLFWAGANQTPGATSKGSTGSSLASRFESSNTQAVTANEPASLASVLTASKQSGTAGAKSGAGQQAANIGSASEAANEPPAANEATADTASSGPAETAAATQAAQTPAAAAPASTALTLNFDERSWVSVHDATGKQLLVGIYESTTRTLKGQPPYKVVIGYAPGVEVDYAGEPVSFDVADNNTARFSVGSGNG